MGDTEVGITFAVRITGVHNTVTRSAARIPAATISEATIDRRVDIRAAGSVSESGAATALAAATIAPIDGRTMCVGTAAGSAD